MWLIEGVVLIAIALLVAWMVCKAFYVDNHR